MVSCFCAITYIFDEKTKLYKHFKENLSLLKTRFCFVNNKISHKINKISIRSRYPAYILLHIHVGFD